MRLFLIFVGTVGCTLGSIPSATGFSTWSDSSFLLDATVETRSISFENPTGAKGGGGRAASNLGVGRKGAPAKTLQPGEAVELCRIEGPGVIRHVWITTGRSPENLRSLVIRAYWDGQKHPSIECPLGDFMGFAHGKVIAYQSVSHSLGKMAALNIWVPMPFLKEARLTLTNESSRTARLYYQVDATIHESALPEDVGRLHVLFRRENPTTPKRDFEILPLRKGKGRYLGCVLGVRRIDPEWWGEGEVKMYIDGDTEFPTICGTGAEDYLGLSFGIQETTHLFHGCCLNRDGYVSGYRWHLPDPVVWKHDIRITIQQLGWIPGGYADRQDDWSVAAFWYEPVPSAPLPPFPSLQERTADLPQLSPFGNAVGEISPLEAAHLVEFRIPEIDVTRISPDEELGVPRYFVKGRMDDDVYEAVVDARVARVISIEKNGKPYWKWEGVLVSAHRGASLFAPENTLAAVEKAIELGADIIEMDIRQTKDGHLVLLHDSTLDRTTNGTGKLSEKTLEKIRSLDAGGWFDEAFKGERVPTLDEVLQTMRGRARPDIDFKAGDPRKLAELLRRHGFETGVSLYCNDLQARRRILELLPGILPRPKLHHGKWSLGRVIQEWDPPLINVEWKELTGELVREIHLAGKQAFVNVHSRHNTREKMIAAIESGADVIQSDSLDLLVSLLRERGLHP